MNKELPISEINELSEILKEKGLTEIEVESKEFRIKVRKEQTFVASAAAAPVAQQDSSMNSSASAVSLSDPNIVEVTAPMVGTFYSSASPGAEAFAKVGSQVKTGDVLCIIEAMKIMNELPSEISGEVLEVLAEDSQAISYGQVLMRIRKN